MKAIEMVRYLKAYYRCDNPTLLAAVRDSLDGWPPAHLDSLVKLVVGRCRWMPTVAEILSLERELARPMRLALPEPALTPEEYAAGAALLGKLVKQLAADKLLRAQLKKMEQENLVLKADLGHAAENAEHEAIDD